MEADPVNAFVAAQIARHRVEGGVRLDALAHGAGGPKTTVSSHLTGQRPLSLINLYRLAGIRQRPRTRRLAGHAYRTAQGKRQTERKRRNWLG